MKKIILWGIIIVVIMLAAKNPRYQELITEQPLQLYHWAMRHIQGVTDYQPEQFLTAVADAQLKLNRREQRYLRNISHSSSDLLLFYNRHCGDTSKPHLVLADAHLITICQLARQTLALED